MFRLLQVNGYFSVFLAITSFISAQTSPTSVYTGYSLTHSGDPNSTVYETAGTPANVSTTFPEPDVYLNASVHVGEIFLEVDDIAAKVNLDAQVLQLLKFNAGVDASIERVRLVIKEVNAKVLLEARLSNLLLMVSDVLDSIDLNPIIATLGNDLNHLINTTAATLTGTKGPSSPIGAPPPKVGSAKHLEQRSFRLTHNILYSVNDYTGNTHMNRVLAKNGDIVDHFLDNHGNDYNQQVVGNYETDMTYNGHNMSVLHDGYESHELEYEYVPFPGLSVVSAIYITPEGQVVGTQVLSEAAGGGTSTVEGKTQTGA